MKRMLVNATEPMESRIAVIDQSNNLEEFYLERASQMTLVGNIYLGRVVNIQPNLQAAFVDIGLEKKGFLHVSETVSPQRKKRPDIRSVLKNDQSVLVEVTRDEIDAKGPSLTMDISLAGRYLVFRPQSRGITISKRITEADERIRLKKLLERVGASNKFGLIIRTAGAQVNYFTLKKDLAFLTKLWGIINRRWKNTTAAPSLIYQESDLFIRTLRDIFDNTIDEILIDSQPVFNKVVDFFYSTMPRYRNRVKFYQPSQPIFNAFNVESQVKQIYENEIKLKSGGSIVIEPTEALVSIDVNSGRFRKAVSPAELAFRTNLEAARVIAQQLRIRDLGGVVIIDFIEMRNSHHCRQVEKVFREELKKDRSKTNALKISRLGLMELARQKLGPGKMFIPYEACARCQGTGLVKSAETIGLEVLRLVRSYNRRRNIRLIVEVSDTVGDFLTQTRLKKMFAAWSRKNNNHIIIRKQVNFNLEKFGVNCYNLPPKSELKNK